MNKMYAVNWFDERNQILNAMPALDLKQYSDKQLYAWMLEAHKYLLDGIFDQIWNQKGANNVARDEILHNRIRYTTAYELARRESPLIQKWKVKDD